MADDASRGVEPIFGPTTIPVPYLGVADEIERKFGKGGGFLIDYACGAVSFRQYVMKCDVQGIDDYNIGLLTRVCHYYQKYVDRFSRFIKNQPYHVRPDMMCAFKRFKSRVIQLKYEISQLNLKGIDSI
jgi:hypothetical protein